jgi:hypothetical protein
LTSFASLVVYQALFSRIGLKQQLSSCFRYLKDSPIYSHVVVVLLLVVHLLLGFRRLQDMRNYSDEPVVHRPLGLEDVPDVAPSAGLWRDWMSTVSLICVGSIGRGSWNSSSPWDRPAFWT